MLGFQAFAKRIMRAATHCSVSKYSSSKPLSLSWSFKQSTNMLMRCVPIPGSGLTILNLRQILQKCKQECDSDIQISTNVIVLSKTSLIDIIGMRRSLLTNIVQSPQKSETQ